MKTREDWERVGENRLWAYEKFISEINGKLAYKEQELLKTLLLTMFQHGVKDGVEETFDSMMDIMKKKK